MPSDAVIKNALKGGGITRYKRGKDMVTICVTSMYAPSKRRDELCKIAEKLLKDIIDKNYHLYITTH
jgi:hypothetical protein